MANEEHLAQLKQGVEAWNQWWAANRDINSDFSWGVRHEGKASRIDLIGADLSGADLSGADLSRAELIRANLSGADLSKAKLAWATLIGANLSGANLSKAELAWATINEANLSGADLSGANLRGVGFSEANLSGANLSETNLTLASFASANLFRANLRRATLQGTILVKTNLEEANLTGCRVYGTSVWGVRLIGTYQSDLIITPENEPEITVDNLEVAQFIYLLLHNENIRRVIDTITSKAVLILGRFTPERKAVLDAIREELRRQNYLPILFDFEKPTSRDFTETISTLAHMARFIIADLTEAKSIPQELQRIIPDLPSVPVQPLLQVSASEYGMFEHFKRYPWVLETYKYERLEEAIASLTEKVIAPAELKANELLGQVRR